MDQNKPTRNEIALAVLTALIPRYISVDDMINNDSVNASAVEASFLIADAFLDQSKKQ